MLTEAFVVFFFEILNITIKCRHWQKSFFNVFGFQFSEISEETKGPKGSEDHADGVMAQAQDCLKYLKSKNTFRPKVLALVYHNGNFFVGSSIAVNHYLRPLCLFNRIRNFKYSLKKAVVYYQPLQTEDNIDWASVAFSNDRDKTYKAPCKLCKSMFKNLSGFPTETDNQGEESFLAACAEYVPINQHLSEDDIWVDLALRKYRDQCAELFQDFKNISEECRKARDDKSSDVGRYSEVVYNKHVKEKIHILGIKPEQNRSLKNHVEEAKVVAVSTVLFLSILCLCRRLLVAEEQGSSRWKQKRKNRTLRKVTKLKQLKEAFDQTRSWEVEQKKTRTIYQTSSESYIPR